MLDRRPTVGDAIGKSFRCRLAFAQAFESTAWIENVTAIGGDRQTAQRRSADQRESQRIAVGVGSGKRADDRAVLESGDGRGRRDRGFVAPHRHCRCNGGAQIVGGGAVVDLEADHAVGDVRRVAQVAVADRPQGRLVVGRRRHAGQGQDAGGGVVTARDAAAGRSVELEQVLANGETGSDRDRGGGEGGGIHIGKREVVVDGDGGAAFEEFRAGTDDKNRRVVDAGDGDARRLMNRHPAVADAVGEGILPRLPLAQAVVGAGRIEGVGAVGADGKVAKGGSTHQAKGQRVVVGVGGRKRTADGGILDRRKARRRGDGRLVIQ